MMHNSLVTMLLLIILVLLIVCVGQCIVIYRRQKKDQLPTLDSLLAQQQHQVLSPAMTPPVVKGMTARAIERERQGGLPEASVRMMLNTLEQVNKDHIDLRFTGREYRNKNKRENK